jgi:hypothetical protein
MPFKECPNYFRPIEVIVLLSCKTTLGDGDDDIKKMVAIA